MRVFKCEQTRNLKCDSVQFIYTASVTAKVACRNPEPGPKTKRVPADTGRESTALTQIKVIKLGACLLLLLPWKQPRASG